MFDQFILGQNECQQSLGSAKGPRQHGETLLRGPAGVTTNLGFGVSAAGTNTSTGSTGICIATCLATVLRWDFSEMRIGSMFLSTLKPIHTDHTDDSR